MARGKGRRAAKAEADASILPEIPTGRMLTDFAAAKLSLDAGPEST